MDDHAPGTLSDEDIKTILPDGGVATTLETDPDTKDADGTDGDSSDADGTDGTDSDGTDGTDSDGTDGTDSDGTDGDSSATA